MHGLFESEWGKAKGERCKEDSRRVDNWLSVCVSQYDHGRRRRRRKESASQSNDTRRVTDHVLLAMGLMGMYSISLFDSVIKRTSALKNESSMSQSP